MYSKDNVYKSSKVSSSMAVPSYDAPERMDTLLPSALRGFEARLGGVISFGEPTEFILDGSGRYHAIAGASLNCAGKGAGRLIAVSLKQYDGTGKEGDFTVDGLREMGIEFPSELSHRPQILLPRHKTGIALEGMFPLFSVHDERVRFHAACLDEITLDSPENPARLELAGTLGMGPVEFGRFLDSNGDAEPEVYLTVYGEGDEREGDPHAIVNAFQKPVTQVVGFVAVEDKKHPLYGLLESVGKRLNRLE